MIRASARNGKSGFAGMLSMPAIAVGRVLDAARPAANRWRIAAEAYADEAWIDAQLARQAAFSSRYDDKTCAALFMASFAHHIAAPLARSWVRRGRLPMVRPDEVRLRDGVRLHLVHFRLRLSRGPRIAMGQGDRIAGRSDNLSVLRDDVEAYFQPLIAALSHRTGISRQALWRLAGDAVSAAFLEAGRRAGRQEQAMADAMVLLKATGSPLNNRQLGYFKVTVADPVRAGRAVSRTFRQRGGCCRYYTAFPDQLCSTCVLRDPAERDTDFQARLLRRLTLRRLPERLYRHAKARLFHRIHPGSGSSGGGLRGPSA